MTSASREGLVATALGMAVVLQGIGIIVIDRPGAGVGLQIVVASLAVAAAVAQTWRVRMRLNHRVDMLVVMAGLGGLGMVVGSWLDLALADRAVSPAAGAHCPHHAPSAWAMVPTWMTGMMLVAALPAAALLTRCAELARTGWRRWLSTHVIGNGLMVVGMVWCGHWLGGALGRLTGAPALGHQLAMLLGMVVGMELGMFAGEAVLCLKPWREWQWGRGLGPNQPIKSENQRSTKN